MRKMFKALFSKIFIFCVVLLFMMSLSNFSTKEKHRHRFARYVLHAVSYYKEHLYKERLVDFEKSKEQRLVDFQKPKERVLKANYSNFFILRTVKSKNSKI